MVEAGCDDPYLTGKKPESQSTVGTFSMSQS